MSRDRTRLLCLAALLGAGLLVSACRVPQPAVSCTDDADCPGTTTCAEAGFCVTASVDGGEETEHSGPITILSFMATPTSIEYGESVQLSWQTQNADDCSIDHLPVSPVAGGQETRQPVASRFIYLFCTNTDSEAQAEVEVQVSCSSPSFLILDPNEPTYVTSRAELETLVDGISGCFELEGDLHIKDSDDIEDLMPLFGLVRVDGEIALYNNLALDNLEGLNALAEVTDDLFIGWYDSDLGYDLGNPNLRSIRGLRGLRYVWDDLEIQDNYELESISGLEELREVHGELSVEDLDLVTNLRPLRRLTLVGWQLDLDDLPRVTSLDGLEALTSVERLTIDALENLEDVSALSNLTAARSISLLELTDLDDLTGLEQVRGLTGVLEVRECDRLANLAPLTQAIGSTLERLIIIQNELLQDLGALSGLTALVDPDPNTPCDDLNTIASGRCPGSLTITRNSRLQGLSGLEGVTTIDGGLTVVENATLPSLSMLGGVTTLGGNLRVESNASLSSLGLDHSCSFGGAGLSISENPQLSQAEAQALADAWTSALPGVVVRVEGNGQP